MENQSEDENDKSNKAQGKKDHDNIISHLRRLSFRGLLISSTISETLGVKIPEDDHSSPRTPGTQRQRGVSGN